MGATKTDLFTQEQNEISILTKALGHPARISIIEYLMSVDACICGDIVNVLPLAQPTVSQHLKELKNAGIIRGNIDGTAIYYCIDKTKIQQLISYFEKINSKLKCISIC
jgi:ArsR family transcriptional regulator, arsenate/arsenite/antimonite-responsive transcriptional repressor